MNTILSNEKSTGSPLHLHRMLHDVMNSSKLLFVKTSYINFAFSFAQKLIYNNYNVIFNFQSDLMNRKCEIMQFDVIDMKETTTPDVIMEYMNRNQNKWSAVIISVSRNYISAKNNNYVEEKP